MDYEALVASLLIGVVLFAPIIYVSVALDHREPSPPKRPLLVAHGAKAERDFNQWLGDQFGMTTMRADFARIAQTNASIIKATQTQAPTPFYGLLRDCRDEIHQSFARACQWCKGPATAGPCQSCGGVTP